MSTCIGINKTNDVNEADVVIVEWDDLVGDESGRTKSSAAAIASTSTAVLQDRSECVAQPTRRTFFMVLRATRPKRLGQYCCERAT